MRCLNDQHAKGVPAYSGKKANSIEKLTNDSGIGSLAPKGELLTGMGVSEDFASAAAAAQLLNAKIDSIFAIG